MIIKKVNIGLCIEQRLNEIGISKSELGRRIGVQQQNINRILEHSNINTDKLITICEALDFNFFTCYSDLDEKAPVSVNDNNVTADNGAVAIVGNVSGHHISTNTSSCDTAILMERVKALEAVLAEKERLINVYEKILNNNGTV